MAITAATVKGAQEHNAEDVRAIVKATEGLIAAVAREAANKVANGHQHAATMAEEFESTGRLAMWEAISRWDESHASKASAETFLFKRIRGAIAEAVYAERNPGADHDAMRTYMLCLKTAKGDGYLAERLARSLPDVERRLSPDRAEAARLAYQGTRSLDAPANGGSADEPSGTFGDSIASDLACFDVPDDLVTPDDRNRADRKARIALVHDVLDSLSPLRREVLKARAEFGEGKTLELAPEDIARLVEARILERPTRVAVNDAWRKGCKQFADRFPIEAAYARRKPEGVTA